MTVSTERVWPTRGRMRAAVATCMLALVLLEGLLAGTAEGHSVTVETFHPYPAFEQKSHVTKKASAEVSKESLEDNTKKDPNYVPDYDEEYYDDYDDYDDDYYWYSEEDEEDDTNSQEDGGSFIASEETEEGKLWTSKVDPDWTPPRSLKDDGQDDSSGEDSVDSRSDETVQTDSRPYPEVTFPEPGVVNAEYGYGKGGNLLDDDGSYSQEDTQDFTFQEPLPVKSNRIVKRSYQTSQQVVQVPQQVVKEAAPYESDQGKIDSGLGGFIQEGDGGGYSGVSTGVEPVFPVGGIPPREVGAGVEPELEGTAGDKDEDSRGSSVGGWFREGWRRFTGAVEDLGDQAEDTFRNLGKEVEHTAGRVHETISTAVDKLQQKYDELRKRLPEILDRFKALILKFGVVIQEGARYCLRRFENSVDKVLESQVIEKLEQKLAEGHAEVAAFFQILGEKVRAWKEEHGSAHVDAGLLDGYTGGSGQTQQEGGGQHRQDIEEMPDFFQDIQVIQQLDKLKEEGVLTQGDIIILTQEHVTHHQQNQHQDQNQGQLQDQQQGHLQDQQQGHLQDQQQGQLQDQQQGQLQDQQQSQLQDQQQGQLQDQQQSQLQDQQQSQLQDQQQSQLQDQQQGQLQDQQQSQQSYYNQQRGQRTGEFIQFPE